MLVQPQPQKGTPRSEQGPVLCVATCAPGDWARDGPALGLGTCSKNRKSPLVVEEATVSAGGLSHWVPWTLVRAVTVASPER